jgi:hypothetical protein
MFFKYYNQSSGYTQYNECVAFKSDNIPSSKSCRIGDLNTKAKFVLIGDSHARADIGMISVWLKNINQSALLVVQAGGGVPAWNKSDNRNIVVQNVVSSQKYKYIILAASWGDSIPNTPLIQKIIDNHAKPIIILDTPHLPDGANKCGQTLLSKLLNSKCTIAYNEKFKKQNYYIEHDDYLNKNKSKLAFIDPKDIVCNDNICNTAIDKTNLYVDNEHLSYKGSTLIGNLYMKKYGNPLKKII